MMIQRSKMFVVAIILLNDVRFGVFVTFCLRRSRFFQWLCLGFFKILLGLTAGV